MELFCLHIMLVIRANKIGSGIRSKITQNQKPPQTIEKYGKQIFLISHQICNSSLIKYERLIIININHNKHARTDRKSVV